MKKRFYTLPIVSMMIALVIVYGSALFGKLLAGRFLFEQGFLDYAYFMVTIAIALPMVLYSVIAGLIPMARTAEVITFSTLFIFLQYGLVSTVLVFEDTPLDVNKFVLAIFTTVLLLMGTSHLAVKRD